MKILSLTYTFKSIHIIIGIYRFSCRTLIQSFESKFILERLIIMVSKKFCTVFIPFLILCLTSCAPNESTVKNNPQNNNMVELKDDFVAASNPVCGTTFRDNTPVCLVPVASGQILYANQLAKIDASNASEGYIMVQYTGNNPKVKLQITGADQVTYTYSLNTKSFEVFPLSSDSGYYKVAVYENVTGNQYSTALSKEFPVEISNKFGPNLYPNQYVNFSKDFLVVSKAAELAAGCENDLDVVTKIYNYVASSITYDHQKAETVQSGYTSNVDIILTSGTGICLDYAAVMTSMLRSQRIPTRLEVGYAGTAYHAWISTYITNVGWVNGIIHFDGESWSIMDPTFAANSSQAALKSFIGDGSNYHTKYIY